MRAGSRYGSPRRDPAQRVSVLAVCLLCAALVFDLFDFATRTGALGLPAYWMAATGLALGALALALALHNVRLPIPWHEMHRSALALFARLLAIVLFGASWALRRPEADITLASLALSVLGAGLAVGAFWRGGGSLAQSRRRAERQASCETGPPPPSSRMGLGEDSLPPETGRAQAH